MLYGIGFWKKSSMDTQTELRDLFEKLSSWRKESQREFSNIMNFHGIRINKGINDLVKEVGTLQNKLSAITKERNDLLVVVNFSGEHGQQNVKSPNPQFLQSEEIDNQVTQEIDTLKEEDPCENELDVERRMIGIEPGDQDENIDSGGVADTIEDNTKYPFNIMPTLHDSSCNGSGDDNYIDSFAMDEEATGDEALYKMEDKKPLNNQGGRKLKCEQCPYETTRKSSLLMHKQGVHDKLRNHVCKECGHAASHMGALKRHIKIVHEKIKSHNCGDCDYATSLKIDLKRHRESVHNEVGEKFTCEQCAYTSSRKNRMKVHIKAVHDKIRDHICGECGFAALRKNHLTEHIKGVHDKIKDYVCGECGYAALKMGGLKKHRLNVHNIV